MVALVRRWVHAFRNSVKWLLTIVLEPFNIALMFYAVHEETTPFISHEVLLLANSASNIR